MGNCHRNAKFDNREGTVGLFGKETALNNFFGRGLRVFFLDGA